MISGITSYSANSVYGQSSLFNKSSSYKTTQEESTTQGAGQLSAVAAAGTTTEAASTEVEATGIYSQYDTDGDGILSESERQAMLEAMAAELESAYEKMQSESSTTQTKLQGPPPGPPPGPLPSDVVSSMDADESGSLSATELDSLLASLQEDEEESALSATGSTTSASSDATDGETLIGAYDTDRDGELNETEFASLLQSNNTLTDMMQQAFEKAKVEAEEAADATQEDSFAYPPPLEHMSNLQSAYGNNNLFALSSTQMTMYDDLMQQNQTGSRMTSQSTAS